jgi:diguanylate cyclase (GGDEF)-like protein
MMNPAGLAMIEADSLEQVRGHCIYPRVTPEHRDLFIARTAEVFQGKQCRFEFEVEGLKGRRLWLESTSVPFRDENGDIVSALAITRDISQRKQYEQELRELSLVDELTGLSNRRGFMLLATQQMKIADRTGSRLALLFADLDHLKQINDTHGHGEGDLALTDAAAILRSTFRASDIVARIGGDEFAALSMESSDQSEEAIGQRLQEHLHAHNLDRQRPSRLSISYGIAVYNPRQPVLLEQLLEEGDRLMYQQKRAKRNASGLSSPT